MKYLLFTICFALASCNPAYATGNYPNGTVLNSPSLTGTPTAPTATSGTNTTQIATQVS